MTPFQSAFDPKLFGQMTFTESNSTESIPVPVGDYRGTISKQELKQWSSADGSSSGVKLSLSIKIEDPKVSEVTGRPSSTVVYETFLDITEDGRGLDFGKGMNVGLGRARAAAGLNKPGVPFSFDMFVGREVLVQVSHDQGKLGPIAKAKSLAAPGAGGAGSSYTPPGA